MEPIQRPPQRLAPLPIFPRCRFFPAANFSPLPIFPRCQFFPAANFSPDANFSPMPIAKEQPSAAVNRISGQAVIYRQLTVGLVCLLLLGSAVVVFAWRDRQTEWKRRQEQAGHRLTLAFEIISRELSRVRSDLLFMANHTVVKHLQQPGRSTARQVELEFAEFLKAKKQYQQIRLINLTGMEVARVDQRNQQIKIVPESELQNKASRYYIRQSYNPNQGEIFVSQFDLNQENGILELPIAPVIRFVTPVASENRETQLLLVVNYLGQPLLDDLANIALPGNTYLIREDGEYLLGPNSESAWGWLLDHHQSFKRSFPQTWPHRTKIGQSATLNSEGAFAFRDIGLEQFGDAKTFGQNSGQWLSIVSHHPSTLVFENSGEAFHRLLILAVISLVPIVLLTRFWAVASVRRQHNLNRLIESERQLRNLSELLLKIQEEERKSISREIHDQLGQQVTAINLDLKLAAREQKPDQVRSLVDRAIAESEQLLETLHDFATRIRPPEIDDLGLNAALETYIWDFQSRTRINCCFESNLGTTRLSPSVAINVFRLVQEAMNNVFKHAEATNVEVTIEKHDADPHPVLRIQVSDNGIGATGLNESPVEPTLQKNGRLGILGMKERVQLLGGTIRIESSPGEGTSISIQLPFEEPETELSRHSSVAVDD